MSPSSECGHRLTVEAGDGCLHPQSPPTPLRPPTAPPTAVTANSRSRLPRHEPNSKSPPRKPTPSTPKKRAIANSGKPSSAKSSPGVLAAKRKATQVRIRQILLSVLTVLVSIIFGGVGFVSFRFGAEFLIERDEMSRQQVRDEEIHPLVADYQQRIDSLLSQTTYLQERLKQAEADRTTLIQSVETSRALQQQVTGMEQIMTTHQAVQQLEEKISLHESFHKQYTQGIQLLSRTALVEKFGAGPYFVRLELGFPDMVGSSPPHGAGFLLLQLATADEMPHTVYTFLSRVNQGLYDGCSFYLNAGHVLMGGAQRSMYTPKDVDLVQRFVSSGLEQLHFQEYNSAWRHDRLTVGLAGRPGGTEFYINLRDNSEIHSPGQESLDHGDPCFARIVGGLDSLAQMETLLEGGSTNARVAILSAKIHNQLTL